MTGTLPGWAGPRLPRLTSPQQEGYLLGVEQPRQAQEILFFCRRAELTPVVEHPVEVRRRLQGLERRLVELIRGVPAALRFGEFTLLVIVSAAQHMVPVGLQFRGITEQDRNGRQEHRGRLAALPGPDEPAHRLREIQRGAHARRVDADGQPRDVHATSVSTALYFAQAVG